MMLIPGLNKYQDAPDGLYQQYHNSRTQDSSVGPSGVHHLVTPPLTTGLVQRSMLVALAAWTLVLVMRSAPTSHTRPVFVPSGV